MTSAGTFKMQILWKCRLSSCRMQWKTTITFTIQLEKQLPLLVFHQFFSIHTDYG